jgi:hypothetical protein
MFRTTLLSLGALLALALAFFAGVFVTSFNDNLCYSNALVAILGKANSTFEARDANGAARFKASAKSLPIWGYETNCSKLSLAIEQHKGELPQ